MARRHASSHPSGARPAGLLNCGVLQVIKRIANRGRPDTASLQAAKDTAPERKKSKKMLTAVACLK